MKISLLILLFLSFTSLYADSKTYIGVGIARVSEKIDSQVNPIINSEVFAKIGYGERDGYAAEISLNYLQNRSKIVSNSDAQKLGFNIALIKAYDFGIYINPFLKAGFGAGTLKTDADTTNQSLTYGSFDLGTGFFIPLSNQVDLELGYRYQFVNYEKIDLTSSKSPSSYISGVYLGFNLRFWLHIYKCSNSFTTSLSSNGNFWS